MIARLISLFLAGTALAASAADPLKVLYITGGCCHDYPAQADLIPQGVEERANVKFTVFLDPNTSTASKMKIYENPEWAAPYDVIIHNECYADVKDPAWTQRILKPHKEGKPGVVIHCAMHCYRDGTDEWFRFCGVTSHRHGAHYPHEVRNANALHPIMKGWGPAWANPAGELYWIEKVWPDTTILGEAKNQENGKAEPCVWTSNYLGKTRVFGTTLGHHNETVNDGRFLDLLARGIVWAAGKETDDYLRKAEPKRVPVNLAKGKAAKASSEESDKNNLAANAFDGNAATRWCASGPQKGEWLEVDLGKAQSITGARLAWEGSHASYQFKLEGSADGKAWQLLHDASSNPLKSPNELSCKADGIRFVRVTFLGTDAGGWASLWEMAIHGTETEVVTPANSAPDDAPVLSDVKVPAGFDVNVFATPPAANYPVYVTAAPDGTLFVSCDKNGSLDRNPLRGSVVRLRDTDGDGRADQSNLFVPDVDSPRGAVWDHDRLYLVHPPHLSAFIDHNGDGVSDEQKILVKNIAFGFKDRPADHTTNGLTLGIDGWLYVAVGDFGFVEAEGADGTKLGFRHGGIVRVRPDGSGLQIYTTGTRNILDVALSPLLDGFCRDNTNDGGGWDMRFHHFTGLEDHGYPRLYMNFPDEHIKPLAEYGGGSGCGGAWLDEPGFPEPYRNIPLTCDWGRSFTYSHHVTPSGSTFKDDVREFIGMTRVTDVDPDAMSRIYAASWRGASFNYSGENVGYVVTVKPKDYTPDPLPDFAKASDRELVGLLASPSARRRLEAQRTLLRRGLSPEAQKEIVTLIDTTPSLPAAVAALFTATQSGGAFAKSVVSQTLSTRFAKTLRPFTIRAMADHDKSLAFTGDLKTALHEELPRTRLEALVAAARLGDLSLAGDAAASLGHPDPVIAHTAFRALAEMKGADACFAVVDATDASYDQRKGALFALMRMHEPAVVDGLIARAEKEKDSARLRGLLGALARLHFKEGPWKGDSWGTRPDTRGPYYQPEKWEASDRILAALQSALGKAQGDDAAWLATEMTRNRIEDSSAARQMVTLAATDRTVRSSLISQLVKKDAVPQEAIAVITKAATEEETAPAERANAIAILTRTDNAEAWQSLPAALAQFRGPGSRKDAQRAEQAFLGAPKLENFHTFFETLAAKTEGPASLWAEAAVLALSSRTSGAPESREQTGKSLEAGWTEPKRRAQILTATAEIQHRPLAPRVLAALKDADPAVVAAARRAVKALKLDPADADLPKIESMKPEEVIAAVVKLKGDPAIGAQIFTQATCHNCHTVAKDVPQKGPYLGTIADTYPRAELAEAILNPNKTLAQGFVTNFFILEKGDPVMGFVVQEGANEVTIRNQAGAEQKIATANIKERQKLPTSLMPPGLMNQLTVKDFASLLDYLQQLAREQAQKKP